MKRDGIPEEPVSSRWLGKDGKPLKILSTSLGVALLANAMMPGLANAESQAANAAAGPKLLEWSTEAVKAYYDPAVDWNLPLPKELAEGETAQGQGTGGTAANGGSGGTTIINNGSGFGWDDLILYHLLFNNGYAYSSTSWTSSHPTYYAGSTKRYKPKTYSSETFQNKPVAGSSVRPKTKDSTGTITRRSTSSKQGSIGGKSSGFSSSKSSSSRSSGGFGG